ncbi:MAG: MurR/RpiR family transcriptional regulator, partial [Planctomycetes bacterium]|nr:MurR/RpiR family transcriptional regulator [Planctomycetota bacterium]
MSQQDLLARIAAAQPTLSRKASAVARYLAEHYVEAGYLTTREIARASGVGLTTVVRFPAMLGYADMEALKAAIQDRVGVDLTAVERMQAMSAKGGPKSVLARMIDSDVTALRSLGRTIDEAQLERCARLLAEASSITVLGLRWLRPIAEYAAYALAKVRPGVGAILHGDSTLGDRLEELGRNDLLVAVAVARYPRDTVEAAQRARARGMRIIALTDGPLSPLAPLADEALFVRQEPFDFIGSLGAMGALVNVLVTLTAQRLGPSATQRLDMLERASAAGGTYAGDARQVRKR